MCETSQGKKCETSLTVNSESVMEYLNVLKPSIANQEMQLAGGGIFAHNLHLSSVFVHPCCSGMHL